MVVGSIERIVRLLARRQVAPSVIMLVVCIGVPDPSRRVTGYGGVLPVPAPSAPAPSTTPRLDPVLDQQHRDARAIRGRVLYATGSARQMQQQQAPRTTPKAPCPLQRVVQGRAAIAAPNS
ncbi:MAG TPA: hypothetical protein VK636_18900 [Gemmatimonadaceae bacterium]|nr:hypothetical protein [Gemmatimonadaceae bacterium]